MSSPAPQPCSILGDVTPRRWHLSLLLLITAGGLLLRLIDVGSDGLWIDEAFSLWLAERPLEELLHWVSRVDHHPPLYYVLLRGWSAIFGPAEASVRGLSVLFGVTTIPVMYALGRRLAHEGAGLIGALLFALSPLHIRLSQEARMYALLMLLAALALWAFLWLYDAWTGAASRRGGGPPASDRPAGGSLSSWVGYVVLTAAMLWTHNTAFFFPVALNLLVLGKAFTRSKGFPAGLTRLCRLCVTESVIESGGSGVSDPPSDRFAKSLRPDRFDESCRVFRRHRCHRWSWLCRAVANLSGRRADLARESRRQLSQVLAPPPIDRPGEGGRPATSGALRLDISKGRTIDPWLRRWFLAQAAVLLLWLPWLPAFLSQAADVYRRFWLPRPTVATVASVVGALLFEAPPWPLPLTALVNALLAGLAVRGLVTLRRRSRYAPVLAAVLVLPLAGQWLVSLWRPILYVRTLSWVSVPLHLLLAVGVIGLTNGGFSRLVTSRAILAALAALVLLNGAALAHDDAAPEKESWGDAAALVAERVQPDDLLLFSGSWGQIPFDYYLGRLYNPQVHPPVTKHGLPVDLFDRGVLEPEMTEDDLPRLRSLTTGHERVWLIYSHSWYTDPEGLVPSALAATMTLDREWALPGLQVCLYVTD